MSALGCGRGNSAIEWEPSAILVGAAVREPTGLAKDPVDKCAKGPVGILILPSVEPHAGHAMRSPARAARFARTLLSRTQNRSSAFSPMRHCLNRAALRR